MEDQNAIWMYGSEARGDSRPDSDLDILVVGIIPESDVREMITAGVRPLSISRYSWDEIEGMAAYGSLFLHHLNLEGCPIFETKESEGRLAGLIRSLPRYKNAHRDIAAFRQTVVDVRRSAENGGSAAFELSVLGTVLRHSAILACYLLGKPRFGREEPVLMAAQEFKLEKDLSKSFRQLYQFRLRAEGREASSLANSNSVGEWCNIVETFLSHVEALINESR